MSNDDNMYTSVKYLLVQAQQSISNYLLRTESMRQHLAQVLDLCPSSEHNPLHMDSPPLLACNKP